jgi:hypothetical protein
VEFVTNVKLVLVTIKFRSRLLRKSSAKMMRSSTHALIAIDFGFTGLLTGIMLKIRKNTLRITVLCNLSQECPIDIQEKDSISISLK